MLPGPRARARRPRAAQPGRDRRSGGERRARGDNHRRQRPYPRAPVEAQRHAGQRVAGGSAILQHGDTMQFGVFFLRYLNPRRLRIATLTARCSSRDCRRAPLMPSVNPDLHGPRAVRARGGHSLSQRQGQGDRRQPHQRHDQARPGRRDLRQTGQGAGRRHAAASRVFHHPCGRTPLRARQRSVHRQGCATVAPRRHHRSRGRKLEFLLG